VGTLLAEPDLLGIGVGLGVRRVEPSRRFQCCLTGCPAGEDARFVAAFFSEVFFFALPLAARAEARLALAFFVRRAEGAALTAAGERLVPAARRMAESAAELGRLVASGESAPEGRVRIAAPPGIAFDFLAPFARALREAHPGLRLEVLASVPHIDLARGEADLALRTRCPAQRELVCLGELELEVAAFASADYAASLPDGYDHADVGWITWAPPFDQVPPRPQLEAMIPGFEPAFTSDSYLVQTRAAEVGVGAMILSRARHPFLRDTGLVELDLDLGGASGTMHLVCAKSMQAVPRVQAVIELLSEELGRVESRVE